MKVKCPRCGRILSVPEGTDSITCNCHEYCEDGDNPQDCTLVAHGSGSLDPGIDTSPDDAKSNKPLRRVSYCTTHDKYVYKVPFLINCDWTGWFSKRQSSKFRWHKGEI